MKRILSESGFWRTRLNCNLPAESWSPVMIDFSVTPEPVWPQRWAAAPEKALHTCGNFLSCRTMRRIQLKINKLIRKYLRTSEISSFAL